MSPKQFKKDNFFSLYTDGASHGNPGKAGAGIVLITPDGRILIKKAVYLGEKTNNEAEYLALILGLEEACQKGIKRLNIYIDSQLIVKHLQGVYRVKAEHLKPLYEKVRQLLNQFSYTIVHIKRDKNKLADKLANIAIKQESELADGRLLLKQQEESPSSTGQGAG